MKLKISQRFIEIKEKSLLKNNRNKVKHSYVKIISKIKKYLYPQVVLINFISNIILG